MASSGPLGDRRATFLELGVILERTLDALAAVRARLLRASPGGERQRLFTAVLIRQREELEDAIRSSLLELPAELRQLQVQYAEDPLGSVEDPPEHAALEALARWQTAIDRAIAERLGALVERVRDPAAVDVLDGLVQRIVAHDRRVAIELNTLYEG